VIIERPHRKCRVTIHAARPGVIIGKKGADIEVLRKKLAGLTKSELHLNIVEVRKPELDAALVGESIAQQLERRVSFRRAMKRAVQNAMRMGALASASTSRAAWAAPRSRGPSGTARDACRCIRCARTSTMP
jgi:small subunit ribosomal protein S3